ncbi:hypothetical protein P4O66_019643 [Electrophorus voltai]|uniref:Gasdermin pore forming domain-containing protein n=1 Tax=Electrophorus voltai TaxID=2609070 RepID=A0AAD9E5K9_9TELE|nr:hypothetical protein P4O66_019643 [Electrophorus voltai]
MFDKATKRLVRQIDPDGALFAVSRLTDSEKLKPLAVVIKCPPVWFWQTAKYRPSVFTLNDLLQVLEQAELLTYEEKHKCNKDASLEAGGSALKVSTQGSGVSALSSSLGTLCKENVNIQKLLEDSKDRLKVDLKHPLLGKSKSKKKFTLVMERIFTTATCRIEYSGLEEGSCSGMLKSLKIGTAELSLKESGSLHFDTDVAMDIPPHTVMAYSVRKLNIKSNGQYDVRVWPDGIEADELTEPELPGYIEEEVDGLLPLPKIQDESSSLSALKTELEEVKAHLCVLAHLSHQTHSSLLLQIRKILLDRELLSTLEDKLDELVYGDAVCPFQTHFSDSSDTFIDTFLDLLQPKTTSENSLSTESLSTSLKLSKQNQAALTALYFLMSAAMGLTDDGLILLESFCSSQVLTELNDFVNLLTDDSQPVLFTSLPAPLQNEDMLRRVEQLFSSSNVVLKIEAGKLWTETTCNSGHLPYILCTVIHGLAYLSDTQK